MRLHLFFSFYRLTNGKAGVNIFNTKNEKENTVDYFNVGDEQRQKIQEIVPVQEILSIKLLSTVSKKKGLVTVECAPLHKQEEEGVVAVP